MYRIFGHTKKIRTHVNDEEYCRQKSQTIGDQNPKIKSLGPTPTHKTSKTVKSPPQPPLLEVLEAGSEPNGAEIMEGEEEDSAEALHPQAMDMEQVGCPDGEQPPDDIRFANVPELEADNWGDL